MKVIVSYINKIAASRLLVTINNKLIYIFIFVLFLIKLTPFYYFPIASRLFSSHTLAKLAVVFIFSVILIRNFGKLASLINKNKLLFTFILLFFLGQSLSVITASDVFLFWRGYHNVVAAVFIFVITFYLIQEKNRNFKTISRFVFLSGISFVFIEFLYILFADKLLPVLKIIIQKEVVDSYATNLERGRYSLDLNIELFIPFFLFAIIEAKAKKLSSRFKVLVFAATTLLVYVSFISNFRTRVVNLIFSVFFWLGVLAIKKRDFFRLPRLKFLLPLAALAFVMPVFLSIIFSNSLFSFNVFDRFALQHKREDVDTLEFRISAAQKSVELFSSSPISGVGLGNYAVFSKNNQSRFGFYLINQRNKLTFAELGEYSPHNVLFRTLAETGILGIASYLSILVFFMIRDYRYIRKLERLSFLVSYIVSFWTIFVFMLFNPSYSVFIMGWFWFLRGVIEAIYGVPRTKVYSTTPDGLQVRQTLALLRKGWHEKRRYNAK